MDDFTTFMEAPWAIGMLSVPVAGADSAESTVTVLERLPPASTSAWVTVRLHVYVHVSASWSLESAFASPPVKAGAASHFGSETVIAVSVTLPVFVTVNVYGTTWPPAVTVAVVEDLTTWMDGLCTIGMFSALSAGADSVESTVTVLDRLPPASISACVTVRRHPYTHVSVRWSFESALVSPLDSVGAAAHFGSAIVIPVRVTLPVFVTVKV